MSTGNAKDELNLQEAKLAYERAIALADFQAGFLARTSHELRSPLNQIISLHQLILSDLCDSPEEERAFLTQAQTAIQKVLKNLDLVISISKLVVGRTHPDPQPVQVSNLLTRLGALTHMQAANRSCRLEIVSPDEDLYLYGDPHWLEQALVLLVEGAIASESRQIKIESQSPQVETVEIWMTHDGSPKDWQQALASEAPLPEIEPLANDGLVALSLPFRLQLASQILLALKGQVNLVNPGSVSEEPAQDNSSTCLQLVLPSAVDASLADG
ncbi:MAG TPA: histidine kinase dimerization/phospho-acceptor domain-containing protein [Leptolyngbyaceae cyanobacterium]